MTRTYYVKIEGIFCAHCKETIISFFKRADPDCSLKFFGNIAKLQTKSLVEEDIIRAVLEAGYFTKGDFISKGFNRFKAQKVFEVIEIGVVILLLRTLLKRVLGFDILNVIPVIDSALPLFALFVIGFLTSFHCVGMCGALNLSFATSKKKALLYNIGRITCYSLVGGFAGFFGKSFSVNQTLLNCLLILVSFGMIAFALSMTGLFSIKLPSINLSTKFKTSSTFLLGFLNGFMPCSPLVTMQLYAVSTQSALKGSLAMLLFGLGTLPLMLSFSLFQSFISSKRIVFQKVLSAFILLLSFSIIGRSFSALGFRANIAESVAKDYKVAQISPDEQSQKIEINLSYSGYENIAVKKGIPVTLVINAQDEFITGCNNIVLSKDFGFEKQLVEGKNEINFLPDKKGIYIYNCWMYMLKNKIYVYEESL